MKKHFTFFTFLLLFQQIASAQSASTFSCGPIPPLCTPGHVYTPPQGSLWVGLANVHFAQINHSITDTSGYHDFTCTDSTAIIQGNVYQFSAITGQTYEECVRAWIDFNNDGAFDTTEIVFSDSAIVFMHQGYVIIPVAGQISIPLRMRVASDYSIYPDVNACLPVQYGNYADFTIYLDGPDAISEVQKSSISVFPNPFTHDAQIIFGNALNGIKCCTLNIYNLTGSLMRREQIENTTSFIIHRNELPDGMYYFFLRTEAELLGSGKIIIN